MSWFDGKKAVVPIDFSEDSQRAIDMALNVVARPEDVYVVHVASDLSALEPGVVWETIDDESRRKNLERSFREKFEDSKYRGINFSVAFGDAGHEVANYAEEIDADVIVMPSHGRTGIKRLLIGSVAERVIRLAHCPILVLRDGDPDKA